jgi:hypothetical protein
VNLGGVILASVGIIVVVLVANGRWDAVWAAALGNGATNAGGATGTSPGYQQLTGYYNGLGPPSGVSYGFGNL